MNNEFEKIRTDIQFGNDEVIDSCLRAYMQKQNLVFNDDDWSEFSQKIKSGDLYN